MTIANPRIHIICGICGCNKMFKYEITQEEDENKTINQKVYIKCKNCNSTTSLDELVPQI